MTIERTPSATLGWATVGCVYLLMVWGNLVSATGSGLGCPDWPLCHGTILPPLEKTVIFEWGHRILALLASILMIVTVVHLFRSNHLSATLKKTGKTLLVLLGVQILLGGVTVFLELSLTISTIHLIMANLVFGGFILAACVLQWGDQTALANVAPRSLSRMSLSGLLALLAQLALGAIVRHGHAGLACPSFPNCLDGFWPIPLHFETAVAFAHRWFGFVLLGLFFHLPKAAKRELPALSKLASLALLLALTQVGLGVLTVISGLSLSMRALHAAFGYGLWGVLFLIAIRSGALQFLWAKREKDRMFCSRRHF